MSEGPNSSPFVDSTRGRIVEMLRRGRQTVDELATALGLTDNAVRAHLGTLQRDGLVRPDGSRRPVGPGKPAVLYEIVPDAEPRFSRAYAPVLAATMAELGERLPDTDVRALMNAAGARLAAVMPRASGGLEDRARHAAAVLESLGGLLDVEASGSGFRLSGYGCPLGAGVAANAGLCAAVERMLEEVAGVPVRQCCHHGERPSCCFEIGIARTATPE